MRAHAVKDRVRTHRDRLRAAGLRPVQIWVHDTSEIGFAGECQRQSALIQQDTEDRRDLERLAEIADWGNE